MRRFFTLTVKMDLRINFMKLNVKKQQFIYSTYVLMKNNDY